MRLRIRHKEGIATLTTLTDQSTLLDLHVRSIFCSHPTWLPFLALWNDPNAYTLKLTQLRIDIDYRMPLPVRSRPPSQDLSVSRSI